MGNWAVRDSSRINLAILYNFLLICKSSNRRILTILYIFLVVQKDRQIHLSAKKIQLPPLITDANNNSFTKRDEKRPEKNITLDCGLKAPMVVSSL
jgi:hypothetical protein